MDIQMGAEILFADPLEKVAVSMGVQIEEVGHQSKECMSPTMRTPSCTAYAPPTAGCGEGGEARGKHHRARNTRTPDR